LLLLSAAQSGPAREVAKTDDAIPPTSQTFALTDIKNLVLAPGVKAEAVEYRGRKAVRLTKDAADEAALAYVSGTQLRDGTIDVDIATKLVRPPGVRRPGFSGIAFRGRDDGTHYELFYLRPGNATEDDQAKRNHSVQYTSEPDFGWEKLRRNWPFIYESYADLQTDEWTKMKIEVHGRQGKLYVNGSDKPSLIVDGLKGEDLQGAIALWGYTGQETGTARKQRRGRRHLGRHMRHRCRRHQRHSEACSPGQQPRWHMVRRTWPEPAGERCVARRLRGADLRWDVAQTAWNRDCDVCRMGGWRFSEGTGESGGSRRWAVDRSTEEMIPRS
jgi:hypothetical protein